MAEFQTLCIKQVNIEMFHIKHKNLVFLLLTIMLYFFRKNLRENVKFAEGFISDC